MYRSCNYMFTNIIFVLFLKKITTQVGRLLGYSGGNVGGGAEGAMATITGYEVSPIITITNHHHHKLSPSPIITITNHQHHQSSSSLAMRYHQSFHWTSQAFSMAVSDFLLILITNSYDSQDHNTNSSGVGRGEGEVHCLQVETFYAWLCENIFCFISFLPSSELNWWQQCPDDDDNVAQVPSSWFIHRRYSDFLTLRATLLKVILNQSANVTAIQIVIFTNIL